MDHFSTKLKEPTYIKLRIRHSSFDLLLQLTGRQNESLGAINNIFVGICRVLRGFHISYSYRLDNHDGNFKFIINYMYWFDQMFSNIDLSRNSLPLQLPFQKRKKSIKSIFQINLLVIHQNYFKLKGVKEISWYYMQSKYIFEKRFLMFWSRK